MERQWAICGYFVLIAAQDPCPCGYHNEPVKELSDLPNEETKTVQDCI